MTLLLLSCNIETTADEALEPHSSGFFCFTELL
nr:MAG TPA: hypothetical protein [Caudoviricetes sp.]